MDYDIFVPIKLGLFTLVTSVLIVYFIYLVEYAAANKHNPKRLLCVLFHVIIMLTGLLLTGFAKWLQ